MLYFPGAPCIRITLDIPCRARRVGGVRGELKPWESAAMILIAFCRLFLEIYVCYINFESYIYFIYRGSTISYIYITYDPLQNWRHIPGLALLC